MVTGPPQRLANRMEARQLALRHLMQGERGNSTLVPLTEFELNTDQKLKLVANLPLPTLPHPTPPSLTRPSLAQPLSDQTRPDHASDRSRGRRLLGAGDARAQRALLPRNGRVGA